MFVYLLSMLNTLLVIQRSSILVVLEENSMLDCIVKSGYIYEKGFSKDARDRSSARKLFVRLSELL